MLFISAEDQFQELSVMKGLLWIFELKALAEALKVTIYDLYE